MKIEGWTFLLGFIFFGAVGGIYWYVSRDEAGTTMLALTGALAFLVAFYSLYTAKRVYPRPEDRQSAEVEDADPEYGFFSPHSWWPLVVGLGVLTLTVGLAFAAWVVVFGVFVLMIGLFGWVFEYYRGEFVR